MHSITLITTNNSTNLNSYQRYIILYYFKDKCIPSGLHGDYQLLATCCNIMHDYLQDNEVDPLLLKSFLGDLLSNTDDSIYRTVLLILILY